MAKLSEKLFLELSSGSLRACVTSIDQNRLPLLELFEVPSSGIRRGEVVDEVSVSVAIEALLSEIEEAGYQEFHSCELVLPGGITHFRNVSAKVDLHGLSVSTEHAKALREQLAASTVDALHDVIDLHIISWNAGDFTGTELPLGKRAESVEAIGYVTSIEKGVLAKLVRMCNHAGLKVESTHSSISAAARLIFQLAEKASNYVIIDIGYSTTCGMLFVGQRPNSCFSVKAGSNHITRDIAAALGCELSTAENLKKQFGLRPRGYSKVLLQAASNEDDRLNGDLIGNPIVGGNQDIYPWAAPRVSEIISLCLKNFAIYAKALDGGIMFIGGGSQISDLSPFVSGKLAGIKATRFKPTKESLSVALEMSVSHKESMRLPGFEGLIQVAAERTRQKISAESMLVRKAPQFLKPLLSWFSEISK